MIKGKMQKAGALAMNRNDMVPFSARATAEKRAILGICAHKLSHSVYAIYALLQ